MSTVTRIDWDGWRAAYDEMSFGEQRVFYNQVFETLPEQARASTKSLEVFIRWIGHPVRVVELGGWDGAFADVMIESVPIIRWENHEISDLAVRSVGCLGSPFYVAVPLEDWYWASDHVCDLFVASHVIEHLKFRDVLATFDATECRWIYLQAPLGRTDWTGYHGSHILEVGWPEVIEALDERGFSLIDELTVANVRCFVRRG